MSDVNELDLRVLEITQPVIYKAFKALFAKCGELELRLARLESKVSEGNK